MNGVDQDIKSDKVSGIFEEHDFTKQRDNTQHKSTNDKQMKHCMIALAGYRFVFYSA